jgi:multidrug efflux system outer membrane protein
MRKLLILFASSFILFGCSQGVKLEAPELDLPKEIESKSLKGEAEKKKELLPEKFWEAYNDPILNELVEKALRQNEDILIAEARIEQALAMVRYVGADRFPYLGYGASVTRQRTSEETIGPKPGSTYTTYQLNLNVQYELDLFGRISSQEKASLYRYLSTLHGRDAVKLSVISLVMNAYFDLLAKERMVEVAERQLQTLKEIYNLREKEFELGLANIQVVLQARSEVEAVEQTLKSLKQERELLRNLLALLVGESPAKMFERSAKTSLSFPQALRLPPLLPSEVLERRPDIQSALEELKASAYDVASAKAEYFPRITLTSALGYQSIELANLFKGGATFWNIAGLITGPILDFGKRESKVKLAQAKQREALLNYVKTVRTAFKEVQDSLIQLEMLEGRIKDLEQRLKTLEELYQVSELRYKEGLSRYLEVLDSERALLSAKLDLERLKADYYKSQVYFIKAIGGGF